MQRLAGRRLHSLAWDGQMAAPRGGVVEQKGQRLAAHRLHSRAWNGHHQCMINGVGRRGRNLINGFGRRRRIDFSRTKSFPNIVIDGIRCILQMPVVLALKASLAQKGIKRRSSAKRGIIGTDRSIGIGITSEIDRVRGRYIARAIVEDLSAGAPGIDNVIRQRDTRVTAFDIKGKAGGNRDAMRGDIILYYGTARSPVYEKTPAVGYVRVINNLKNDIIRHSTW